MSGEDHDIEEIFMAFTLKIETQNIAVGIANSVTEFLACEKAVAEFHRQFSGNLRNFR